MYCVAHVCVCVNMSSCVCFGLNEREKEGVCECACECVFVCKCVCAFVCVCGCVITHPKKTNVQILMSSFLRWAHVNLSVNMCASCLNYVSYFVLYYLFSQTHLFDFM